MGKFMIINKMKWQTISFILLALLFLIPQAQAQELKKIVLLPFDVYSKGDSAAIKKILYQNLTESLKQEKNVQVLPADEFLKSGTGINEQNVLRIGKSAGADFIITGSLAQLGETISIDAKIIDVHSGNTLPMVSVQGKELSNMTAPVITAILVQTGLIQKIAKIEIKGNRKIEALAILQQIKSKVGKPFSQGDLGMDIKAIFKMGYFQDVTADIADTTEGKAITFTVQEKGLISEIRIDGNKALSKDDITDALTIKTKQTLNVEKIKADVVKIKTLYESKGYYNVEIGDRVEKEGEKDYRVIFDIKENDRLSVKTITFDGNETFTEKDLKNMMLTTEHRFYHIMSDSDVLKPEQLKQDVNKISSYYFNNGFINAQVAEPEVTHDKKWIYIKIKIQEGKRYKVGKVELSGDLLGKPRMELINSLKVKTGENYARETIVKDMEFLTQSGNDEGYANADVVPKINVRDKEQLVDVDYQLNKGGLVYISRINISGNSVTRDKVIRRQLEIFEGDLYSSSKLKQSYSNLNRLRYFEEVDIQTEKGSYKNQTDINIRVKEKNTGMFMIGAGYSAVDQAIIMAEITQQNFLGRGQIISLKASLGSTTNAYDLSFIEPYLFDLPLWFKYNVWKYKTLYDSYTLDSIGTGVTFAYPIWERISGSIGYSLSANDIQDINLATAPWYIIAEGGRTINSAVTIGLGRDTTDDNIFPTKGARANISVTEAGGPFGGDTNFTKYAVSTSIFYSLFPDIVLVGKGRIGALVGHNGVTLPIFERYVLGGINNLRGLQYLGIENSGTSDVLGGSTMLVFNAEIVFPLVKDAGMKGVVFYDMGNTWDGGYYLNDLRKTAGIGLRWYSPIGPLRLEYGYVLDRRENESAGRFEFTMGMAF
jgi:outer membrane protein insertion porin family